jgi:hypothetical protein
LKQLELQKQIEKETDMQTQEQRNLATEKFKE